MYELSPEKFIILKFIFPSILLQSLSNSCLRDIDEKMYIFDTRKSTPLEGSRIFINCYYQASFMSIFFFEIFTLCWMCMLISLSCHFMAWKKTQKSFSDGKTLKGGSSLIFWCCHCCCAVGWNLFLYTFMAAKRSIYDEKFWWVFRDAGWHMICWWKLINRY